MRDYSEAENSTEQSSMYDKGRRRFIAAGIGGLALYAINGFARPVDIDPKKLLFSKDHLWMRSENGVWIVGVTNHLQSSLGDIVCFDLPCCSDGCKPEFLHCGGSVSAGKKFGSLTSVSASIIDLVMPVTGKLVTINKELYGKPSLINSDPYGKGWMIRVRTGAQSIRSLMSVSSYENFIKRNPKLATYKNIPTDLERRGYVVTGACVNCKYTKCADVCPVCAFHQLPDRVYINAVTCIECDACVPACPVEAIFDVHLLPEEHEKWVALNRNAVNYPIIDEKKPALHQKGCIGPAETDPKGQS